jgi:hypothetical protein
MRLGISARAMLMISLGLTGLGLAAAPIRAQSIEGRVVRWAGGAVSDAEVTAVDTLGDRRAGAVTDSAGLFELPLLEGGRYRVRVVGHGADPTVTEPLDLGPGETVEVEIRVGARPDTAPALVIRARDRYPADYLGRYYERLERYQGTGLGVFITRARLDSLGAPTVGRAVLLEARQTFRDRETRRPCRPAVYWNGYRTAEAWDPVQSRAGMTATAIVEGIEVYHADRILMPAELDHERCGAVLIWTQPPTGSAIRGLPEIVLVAGLALAALLLLLSVGR